MNKKFAFVCWQPPRSSLVASLPAQQSQNPPSAPAQAHDSMAGMDMGQHDSDKNPDATKAANDAMSDHDMDMSMSAHMYMTALRPANPADEKRAEEILAQLRPAIEEVSGTIAWLSPTASRFSCPTFRSRSITSRITPTRWKLAFEFDPAHPTSLLYKKTNDGYELVGAMYTASQIGHEDDLNARVPLSVARWHKHTNLCLPPKGHFLAAGGFERIRTSRFDRNRGSVRTGRRPLVSADLRLDGSRISLRIRSRRRSGRTNFCGRFSDRHSRKRASAKSRPMKSSGVHSEDRTRYSR